MGYGRMIQIVSQLEDVKPIVRGRVLIYAAPDIQRARLDPLGLVEGRLFGVVSVPVRIYPRDSHLATQA